MLSSARGQDVQQLAGCDITVGIVEVGHHALEKTECDDYVKLRALNPVNRRHGDSGDRHSGTLSGADAGAGIGGLQRSVVRMSHAKAQRREEEKVSAAGLSIISHKDTKMAVFSNTVARKPREAPF